jgi:chromosome segregation ATPase
VGGHVGGGDWTVGAVPSWLPPLSSSHLSAAARELEEAQALSVQSASTLEATKRSLTTAEDSVRGLQSELSAQQSTTRSQLDELEARCLAATRRCAEESSTRAAAEAALDSTRIQLGRAAEEAQEAQERHKAELQRRSARERELESEVDALCAQLRQLR